MKQVALLSLVFLPSLAHASEVRAENCEAFVDKVQVRYVPETGNYDLNVFVKVEPSRLDSPLAGVYFYGHRMVSTGTYPRWSDSGWSGQRLDSFVGASDYFVKQVQVPNHFYSDSYSEGAFYLETAMGTRYWINAEGGRNFFFDDNFVKNLYGINVSDEVASLARTGTYSRYLNPRGCL